MKLGLHTGITFRRTLRPIAAAVWARLAAKVSLLKKPTPHFAINLTALF